MTIVRLEKNPKYETKSVIQVLIDKLLFKDIDNVSDMLFVMK